MTPSLERKETTVDGYGPWREGAEQAATPPGDR